MATDSVNAAAPQENATSNDFMLKMIFAKLNEDDAGPAAPADAQFEPEEPGAAIP